MLEKYFLRLPTAQDKQSVYDLMIHCDLRDVGFPDTDKEDLGHDWEQINLARDAWLAFDASGMLHGYCADLPWGEGVRMLIYDDPGTEDTDLFLGLLLMCEKRAVNIIQELNNPAKHGIYTHVFDSVSHQKSILEEAGYRIKKHVFNMHKDLSGDLPDPELPPGFRLRTTISGQDEHAIHELVQEAFDWHERDNQPFDEWKKFMIHLDTFNENLWFLAVKDSEIVGTCLCFQQSDIGWIRQLAVKKPYRKLGIGRALLQRSFQAFKALGLPKAGLAVESVNANAVHFYQTAGMYKAVHLDEYVKEI
jgi:ribosomal protein S18 acetylase RimI-like enzyme